MNVDLTTTKVKTLVLDVGHWVDPSIRAVGKTTSCESNPPITWTKVIWWENINAHHLELLQTICWTKRQFLSKVDVETICWNVIVVHPNKLWVEVIIISLQWKYYLHWKCFDLRMEGYQQTPECRNFIFRQPAKGLIVDYILKPGCWVLIHHPDGIQTRSWCILVSNSRVTPDPINRQSTAHGAFHCFFIYIIKLQTLTYPAGTDKGKFGGGE